MNLLPKIRSIYYLIAKVNELEFFNEIRIIVSVFLELSMFQIAKNQRMKKAKNKPVNGCNIPMYNRCVLI